MINAEDATRPELEAMIYVAQGRRDPHTAQTLFNELLAYVRAEGIAVEPEPVEETKTTKKAK